MDLEIGLVFTGKWFTGKIEVLEVKEQTNELKVHLNNSWGETWNLAHTRQGIINRDYFLLKK